MICLQFLPTFWMIHANCFYLDFESHDLNVTVRRCVDDVHSCDDDDDDDSMHVMNSVNLFRLILPHFPPRYLQSMHDVVYY